MNDYFYIFLAVTGAIFWTALPIYLLKKLAEKFWDDEPATHTGQIKRRIFGG